MQYKKQTPSRPSALANGSKRDELFDRLLNSLEEEFVPDEKTVDELDDEISSRIYDPLLKAVEAIKAGKKPDENYRDAPDLSDLENLPGFAEALARQPRDEDLIEEREQLKREGIID